ncbi:hypothetical protein AAG570_006582 [Ranatra chinensis]|uniref:E3 ubiquitin-protein ligase SHPRH n=1 Tax=Ranatra chinensis TaxID=642074 RepID=A0ABD0YUR3_9HEMI
MLRTFYEASLNSVSARNRRTVSEEQNILKCFCTNNCDVEDQIFCSDCCTYQHKLCVGIDDDYEDEGDYACPHCLTKREPIKSRATFIISPTSIVNQWECEIKKHIKAPDFKVFIYNGVKGNAYIQPRVLASYDVVITTYAVLCTELNYANGTSQSDRKLRHAKRFYSVTSPLTCISWWRICLDEAQMVESYQTKTAMMAQELKAKYRWAVSGTPIQKSINDLFGLIQFLKIQNFDSQRVWLDLIKNKEDLYRFVANILWRSCKKDILHMLGVPKQSVIHHWLRFSPVEGYFYQRTHNECAYHFRLKLARFDDLNITLKNLDRNVVNRLLNPLLKLRQACTHPQAVRGKFLKFKHTLTMDELLTAMVAKAKLDVDGSLREYVSHLNGIAGLHIILQNWPEAVSHYRRVLQLNHDYNDLPSVKVHKMVHALHNLAEVLENNKNAGIAPTLRDDKLREDVEALEQAYIKRYETAVLSAKEYLAKLQATISLLCDGGTLGFSNWWVDIINWVEDPDELLHRITVHLDDNLIPGQVSLSSKLRSLPAVHIELATWLANVDKARIDAIEALRLLELRPLSDIAEAALNCHLRQKKSKSLNFRRQRCQICKCEAVLLRYEVIIFSINKKNILEESDDEDPISPKGDNKIVEELKSTTILKSKKEGSWKPSQTERILQGTFDTSIN